jgi:SAM-dependent methyltransferase
MRFYEYWNDIAEEKKKPYYIQDKSDYKLINFLENETNLKSCFLEALEFAGTIGEIKGRVIDIGAGVAWTSALISRIPSVRSVTAVDFSEHRLMKIAPIVFEQLHGNSEKYKPILGDFLRFDLGEVFDVAIFCQSLYMSPNLDETLTKIRGLLVKGGLIIIACERIVFSYPWYAPRRLLRKMQRFIRGRADASGNYGYEDWEYRGAIERAGFEYHFQLLDYPIHKNARQITAGNHFGIKR